MTRCLDCGEPTTPALTHQLCEPCALIADMHLPGGAEQRTRQLKEATK